MIKGAVTTGLRKGLPVQKQRSVGEFGCLTVSQAFTKIFLGIKSSYAGTHVKQLLSSSTAIHL